MASYDGRSSKGSTSRSYLLHISDREGDFYELFDLAEKKNIKFLTRIAQNRPTLNRGYLKDALVQEEVLGSILVTIARNTRTNIPARRVLMNVSRQQYKIKCPMKRKEEHLKESLDLTGIYVWESGKPKETAIQWYLLTNVEPITYEETMQMVGYYAQRWKIERMHYLLKSGCKIEQKQARTYERLCLLSLFYSVIAMRILSLTYIGRIVPQLPCSILMEEEEWKMLYQIANKTKKKPEMPYSIQEAIRFISVLGGFKGRSTRSQGDLDRIRETNICT